MKVHVDGPFYIKADAMNVTLEEDTGRKTTVNKGKPDEKEESIFKVHGYFATVEQALQKFVKIKVSKSKAKTIAALLKEMRELKAMIKEKVDV